VPTELITTTAPTTLIPVELPNGTMILVESTVTLAEEGLGIEGLPSMKKVGDAIEGWQANSLEQFRRPNPTRRA
jgi:hypothetical protein